MRLQDLKIKTKLLLLIGLMSAVTGIVSFVGVTRLNTANQNVARIDDADGLALLGARMNQNVIMMTRSEYRVASDPSPETLASAKDVADTNGKQFDERIKQAMAAAIGPEKEQLKAIAETYKAYSAGLARTHAIASNVGKDVTLTEAQKRIADSIKESRVASDTLQKSIHAYAEGMDAKGNKLVDETKAQGQIAIVLMIGTALGGLVTGIVAGLLLATYGISAPLNRSVGELRKLASGSLDTDVTGADRGDECGDIAKGLAVFRDNALRARELEAAASAQKVQAEAERHRAMLGLADEFERSVGGIVSLVSSAATEMQAAAAQLTATAQETSAQSLAVSSAAEEAGANVAAVAASTEELGASVTEIGRQVETSAQIASEAHREATEVVDIVADLNALAENIGSFVDLISGLASQTNLLALNATIESARAGDAGKGFAVVAVEVKALAGQTAKATVEISQKISEIQQTTSRAVSAMETIGGTIRNISTTSAAIASAVEQQHAATHEIVQAVSQASMGTSEVTANISGVASAAEQTGAAATQVLGSSRELAEQAERLHAEMDRFLTTVRAA